MFPVPTHGAGITIGRADQGDAHVVRNTRRGPAGIIESRGLRAGDISPPDLPVFIDPQLEAAFEIPSLQPLGGSRLDIAGHKKQQHCEYPKSADRVISHDVFLGEIPFSRAAPLWMPRG